MRLSQILLASPAAAQTLKVLWTTETPCNACGARGPDGPWQGLQIRVGGFTNGPGWTEAMLPSGRSGTYILTRQAGGSYDPRGSASATFVANETGAAFPDPWNPWTSSRNETIEGSTWHEYLSLSFDPILRANSSVVAADRWDITLPSGEEYASNFSLIGLAPPVGPGDRPPSILEQYVAEDLIASKTYGLHIGSVPLGQSGSFILGGYDQNRVLGEVGVFDLVQDATLQDYLPVGAPTAYLVDLVLGVETGGSPFNNTALGSVWQGLGENQAAEEATRRVGGATGSALVTFNPGAPYIQLPVGNCEAIAARLPLTWRENLGLYTWNRDDPQFERIVRSPAYAGFILADRTAKNITIKVPFSLLNLTLESPIVDTPTPYFPCRPADTPSWHLGRAFLQGAFLGLNYDQNLLYLAQAPGPDMDQSVIRTHEAEETTIMSNDAGTFEKTWRSRWTVLEEDENNGPPSSNGTEPGTSPGINQGSNTSSSSLSGGAIAGIVVGVVAVIVVAAVAVFLWRRRRRGPQVAIEEEKPETHQLPEAPGAELSHELHAPRGMNEALGVELRHELDGQRASSTTR
ncbi:hypothetical protein HJFPF1_10888 [Paramyrothecium foliicola]|nr:hypothetical protein HJFPF1_10888 [Paramyrothecium foliicola]